MRIPSLHRWDLSIPEAKALQTKWTRWIAARTPKDFRPALIAGADMSHRRGSKWLYGAVVVLRLPAFEIAETVTARMAMRFPYVPGYLSFREGPVLLACFRKLRTRPDAVVFDAHGRAHPRRFGLACHLGLWLNLPAIGCAKSRLCGTHGELAARPGSTCRLQDEHETIGTVLRTRKGSRPVFVSVGHLIALADAVRVVTSCLSGKHRLPEPTRLAHLAVNAYRRATEPNH